MNCIEMCNGEVPEPVQKISTGRVKKTKKQAAQPALEPGMESFAKTVASMEGKLSHLSEEVARMHSLLLEFLSTQSFPAGEGKQLSSGTASPASQKKDAGNKDAEYAMVVPLKTPKRTAGESLKAMEMELPGNPRMEPPKSGKLFFDFEAWLQAKSKS